MASTNQHNGIPFPTSSEPSPTAIAPRFFCPLHQPYADRGLPPLPASPSRHSPTHDYLGHPQTAPTLPHRPNASPAWNPATLLDPRRTRPPPQSFGSEPDAEPRTNGSAPQLPVFQFVDASHNPIYQVVDDLPIPAAMAMGGAKTTAVDSPHGASPDQPLVTSENGLRGGLGSMIERMSNVHARDSTPTIKKRRLEGDREEDERKKKSHNGFAGSSGLGQYIKKQREEGAISPLPSAPPQTVDLTGGTDDDVEEIDPKNEEVCYGMLNSKLQCFKVPSPKPGAQSIFGQGYAPIVKIVLKRLVGEKTIAIQAYDHTRDIIGNLDPTTSAGLAPLLDGNLRIRTDCRIPARKQEKDESPGAPISRAYNLDLVIYGPASFTNVVGRHLSKYQLKLLGPKWTQNGCTVRNPHVEEYRPPVVQRSYPPANSSSPSGLGIPTLRTVEEIRDEVMTVFDSLADSRTLSEAVAHSDIVTPLLQHQKQGLTFMTTREKPYDLLTPEEARSSLWQRRTAPSGMTIYCNVVSGHQSARPYEARGGILADMMGLGKTLSILALVVGSRDQARVWSHKSPVQPKLPDMKAKGPHQTPLGLTRLKRNVSTTLLVCPLSAVANWEEQIKQHVRPGALKYYVYHGSNRLKDIDKLAEFDLIMTTYGSVSSELGARYKRKPGQYPLEEMGWFRIVLDEAHMIREQATLQFKAICRLQAERRWAVTGTPVQNRLDDLGALLAFLRVNPFNDRGKFQRHIVEPFKACDPEIVPKLRVLVDSITLRRLKDKINLPPRQDQVIKLTFAPEERRIYSLFAKHAQDRVKVLAGNGLEKALGGQSYIHILRSILRLRLICAHGKDLLNEEDLKALYGMSAEMAIDIDSDDDDESARAQALPERKAYEMFDLMQETNSDSCVECGKKLGSNDSANIESEGQEDLLGYMNPCFHIICCSCVKRFREQARETLAPGGSGLCHICHSPTKFFLVELRREKMSVEHTGPYKNKGGTLSSHKKTFENYSGPSTKTKALIEDLMRSEAQTEAHPDEPPYKSVVFSGWTSHLDLIQFALDKAGIKYTRLDGSMSRTSRTDAMDRFREDPSIHVILVSIMAGGLGLNLTAGNNVYVMEPQYNPQAEAQAIDRVHRLGQTRAVKTVRYIMKESFEEKMMELQEKKMKLASLSLDGRDKNIAKGDAARQKLMDLRSLFR